MSEWKHKDEWRMEGKNFLIVVSRHSVKVGQYDPDGGNRWCVYAFIYPPHPYFHMFEGEDFWQEATSIMPLHGGCSKLEYPTYDGSITSVKVGADYNHLYDNHFTNMSLKEDVSEVFKDAEELHMWLSRDFK